MSRSKVAPPGTESAAPRTRPYSKACRSGHWLPRANGSMLCSRCRRLPVSHRALGHHLASGRPTRGQMIRVHGYVYDREFGKRNACLFCQLHFFFQFVMIFIVPLEPTLAASAASAVRCVFSLRVQGVCATPVFLPPHRIAPLHCNTEDNQVNRGKSLPGSVCTRIDHTAQVVG